MAWARGFPAFVVHSPQGFLHAQHSRSAFDIIRSSISASLELVVAARLHFAAFVHVMTEKGREAFTIVVATRATLQPVGLPREEKEEGASRHQ